MAAETVSCLFPILSWWNELLPYKTVKTRSEVDLRSCRPSIKCLHVKLVFRNSFSLYNLMMCHSFVTFSINLQR